MKKLVICFAILVIPSLVFSKDYYLSPFSEDSPWNSEVNDKSIGDVGYVEKNRKLTGITGVTFNTKKWSIPFYLAKSTDPYRNIYIEKLRKYVSIKMPEDVVPAVGTDAHLCIMSHDKKRIYEFYKFNPSGVAKIFKDIDARGSGISSIRGKNIGVRAYGGSAVAGLIRNWELQDGQEINHALALALSSNYMKRGYVWPASSEDTKSKYTYTGNIEMGSLITIDPALDYEDILENKLARKIARALHRYGGFLVDSGGKNNLIFYAEPSGPTEELRAAASELNKIIPFLVITRAKPN